MVRGLIDARLAEIAGVAVIRVSDLDGVKFLLADNSWLLIRPSGTEPVLRVYAEARTKERVQALLEAGLGLAEAYCETNEK